MPQEQQFGLQTFHTRYRLLLLLSIVSLPVSIPLNTLFLVLLFLNSFSAGGKEFSGVFSQLSRMWPYTLLFLLYLISIAYSSDLGTAFNKIQTKGLLIIFAVALGSDSLNLPAKNKIYKWFIISTSVCALFGILNAFYDFFTQDESKELIRFFYPRLSQSIIHPGYFSLYIVFAIILILKLNDFRKNNFFMFWLLPFLLLTLSMLQARTNIIAFGLVFTGFIILRYLNKKHYKIVLWYFLGVILISLLFIRVIPSRFQEDMTDMEYNIQTEKSELSSVTVRLAIWECAWSVIKEHWITGVGIGDADAELIKSYEEKEFVKGIRKKFNTHNQYLQVWLAAGLPAIFAFLAILFHTTKIALKNKDIFLLMGIWFFYLSMTTESMLERHWAGSLFATLVFMMSISPDNHRSRKSS